MRLTNAVKMLSLAAAATLAVQSPVSAQLSGSGSTISWMGGDLTISGISKRAAYADYLFLFNASTNFAANNTITDPLVNGSTAPKLIGDNLPTNPHDATLSWVKNLSVAQLSSIFGLVPTMGGTELVFAIFSDNIDRWNYSGDPNRNAQGSFAFAAAIVTCASAWECIVTMEDKSQAEFGPGEPDANDLRFMVTATPEPGTIGLLATGLLGIAGVAARRRRKNA